MVVLKIEVAEFVRDSVDAKRQPPVSGHAQAPGALAIAGQGVSIPVGERAQFVRVFHVVEECKHPSEFVGDVGGHALRLIGKVKALQTLVIEASYRHAPIVACSVTLINVGAAERIGSEGKVSGVGRY